MYRIIGVLAYACAWAVILLGVFYDVHAVVWCTAVFLAVYGALVAWAQPVQRHVQRKDGPMPRRCDGKPCICNSGSDKRNDAFDMFH